MALKFRRSVFSLCVFSIRRKSYFWSIKDSICSEDVWIFFKKELPKGWKSSASSKHFQWTINCNYLRLFFRHIYHPHFFAGKFILTNLMSSNQQSDSGQISSRPHRTWAPKMVVFSKGNPRIFQGNLGGWNIIPFGQIPPLLRRQRNVQVLVLNFWPRKLKMTTSDGQLPPP